MFAGILVLLAIVGAIYVGYYYRTKKESSLMKSIGMGCLSYFILMPLAGLIGYMTMSDQEKAEMKAEQARQDSIRTVQEVENRKKAASADPDSVTWEIQTKIDEMTDTKNIWASIRSINYVEQDFPYQGDTYATITVRYMKKYGYDVLIGIDRGQIVGIDISGTNYVTARFDDGTPKKYYFNDASDGSTEHVFLKNAKDFMDRCKRAKDIKVDVPMYQAGKPVFLFHVDKPLVWPE